MLELVNAPPLLMPVLLRVNTPVLVMVWPFRSSAARAVTDTAPLPSAVALPVFKVPAEIVVPPVNVLAPESVQVPAPTLVSVPEVVPIIDAKLLPVLVPPSVNPKVLPVMVPTWLITILPLEATIEASLPKVMRPM